MNKISLLTLSVAIALSGCGSDSADNSEQPPIAAGVLITALDGHFYQAVIFDDANKNGKFDDNEYVFGLTNQSGQLELPADYQLKGHLAVQTLTPGGAVQRRLASQNAAYAGKYTIDMDHPAQAMAHEVVLRAPTLEAQQQVISPITDLIVLAMENDPTSDLTQAKQTVANTLGLDNQAELLSDFTNTNPKLHKKAQILTDSKAANPASYEKNAAQFAEQAAELVGNMGETEIKDVNQRPVIINENAESGFTPNVVTNHKLQVSKEVKGKLEADFANLNLKEGDTFADQAFSIADLFSDKDQPTVEVTLEQNLKPSGLSAKIDHQQLVLSSNGSELKAQDNLYLILVATDKDDQKDVRGQVRVQLNLQIAALNQAPVINLAEKETLQQQIDAWYLQQGEAFDQSINISALFNDTDGQVVSYWGGEVQVAGLTIADVDSPMITLSGTPSQASPAGKTFTVKVKDDQGAKSSTTFTLPEVKEGIAPPVAEPALRFTLDHFNNQTWKMGSFADNDGEIGYAALLNHNDQLQMCWGDKKINDQKSYKGNISRSRDFSHQSGGPTPFEVLSKLDQQSGYLNYEHKDCWAVTINPDGTLADTSNQRIEMLYQHQLVDGSYQLLIQYGPVQLFWLDSSETTFSDTLAINKKITAGTTEYTLFVEAGDYVEEFDGPMLSYSYMETQFKEGRFNTISILPDDFKNYGVWSVIDTPDGQRIEQAEELEDQKTRIRYLQRDFGDFYIGVEWSKETNNTESNARYSLFSQDKELMDKLIRHFPIMQD
ncbi:MULTISPECIES: Ig domain-containing protein [Vibrio]|uniref:Ig domain-containing protein n=2 Tax=Unclassified Bacteria TaxID=49928 RepID=A0AAU6UQF1_UNCXX|nr:MULTISPECIES: Ig domain-containing protein [unclassified Vibrio]EKO3578510.1 acid phosphatase [Vibrio metschnikovii]EKO3642418.1 acid phosphatase [Vibrio metschnikovii]EKO3773402.1 acid phosphatase [Vibrio metschnikovii]